MVGDYISTSFANGKAFPIFVNATAPNGGQLNEFLSTVQTGLVVAGGTSPASSEHVIFTSSASPTLRTAF